MGCIHCDIGHLAHQSTYPPQPTFSNYQPPIGLKNILPDNQEPSYNWPGVNGIVRAQDLVGWQAFLEGAILKAWAVKQHEY
jgi:hypothetical protein